MTRICATEKTARRREWIGEGLLELMRTRRFEEITVTELCAHLELPRRSFYRYFRDLEDVLDSALNRIFENMMMPIQPPELADMERNFEFWLRNRAVLDALHRSGMLDKLFDYTTRFADPAGVEHYLPKGEADRDIRWEASIFATGGSVSLVIAWYLDGFRKSPAEMARIAHRLLFEPIVHK